MTIEQLNLLVEVVKASSRKMSIQALENCPGKMNPKEFNVGYYAGMTDAFSTIETALRWTETIDDFVENM